MLSSMSNAPKSPPADDAEVPGTQALMRGIDVLMAVSMASHPPRFGEIQAQVNLPKGTLHRLLAALIRRGLLRYESHTRRYSTGSRVFDLARRTLDQSAITRAAKPELSRLARQFGRPTCLYIADGEEVFVIDFEDSDASQTRVMRVWAREKVAESAAGQAIMGHLPPEARKRVGPPPVEMSLIQALGYAIYRGGRSGQPATVAAAVCDDAGFPVAAISVAFEGDAVSAERLHEAGRLIAEGARRAEGNVGTGAAPLEIAGRPHELLSPELRDLQTGRDFMGENPVWDAAGRRLYWLDILAPALRSLDPVTGRTERRILPEITGGLVLSAEGGLVCLGQNGVAAFDPATGDRRLLVDPEADRPDNRFNTAAVAPDGAIWAGTMSVRQKPGQGALYRIGADLTVSRPLPRVSMPKNPAWSPDGRTLYLADSARGKLFAYDHDPASGRLSGERVLVAGAPETGSPNGIACDVEGFVWAAMYGGWCVRRYSPEGVPDRVIHLPIPMPTAVAFGGADLRTLYITSTYLRLPPGFSTLAPQSGNLFAIRVDVAGQPVCQFGTAT